MHDLFTRLVSTLDAPRDAVLVTLIENHGSAPRGPGAQMLVDASGRLCGTVGGGAVELESERFALRLLSERRCCIRTFALHPDASDSIGMLCGGDVTAHFQFISARDAAWRAMAAAALKCVEQRAAGHLVLREDGGAAALFAGGALRCGEAAGFPAGALREGLTLRTEGFFAVPLEVGERAVIFGAGHVAQSLCPLLRSVGFRPVIFDSRAELLTPALFPDAEALLCGDFSRIGDALAIAADDYCCVMTNGHSHDLLVEEQLLRGKFAYLGVIGSRRKVAAVNEALLARGIPEERLAAVHTPIGLAIRAVTPAEIAVSITAEMIAVRADAREAAGLPVPHSCPMH